MKKIRSSITLFTTKRNVSAPYQPRIDFVSSTYQVRINHVSSFVLPSLRNTRMIRKQYENDTKANE